jgi:glutamine synthetase
MRLTGKHETSSYENFSWGIGTRNTSIRIPNQTAKDNRGYFEDRRPASNIDPYRATSIIFKTCCIKEEE